MRAIWASVPRRAAYLSAPMGYRMDAMTRGNNAASRDGPAEQAKVFILGSSGAQAEELQQYLGTFGFSVVRCQTAHDVARLWNRRCPAVCVLALDATQRDATSTIGEISSRLSCGLIILADTGDASDRVIGLELGADDYLTRPFQRRELIARIRSVLRRSMDLGRDDVRSTAHFGKWSFTPSTLELRNQDGHVETLTAAEAHLLIAMISRPNRLLSREQLQGDDELVDDPAFERSVDVRISRIRKKIECDPRSPSYIKTVYGAGYIFCAPVSWT